MATWTIPQRHFKMILVMIHFKFCEFHILLSRTENAWFWYIFHSWVCRNIFVCRCDTNKKYGKLKMDNHNYKYRIKTTTLVLSCNVLTVLSHLWCCISSVSSPGNWTWRGRSTRRQPLMATLVAQSFLGRSPKSLSSKYPPACPDRLTWRLNKMPFHGLQLPDWTLF